ncbi:ActS/PrrB/RegB family redox-sensitive histidine kinase [Dongia sp.]|uniref:ActS/PrrB/RegB family redox-sensitive histidine kinase n=1 Tax=Dongia sp. TaxID=1977262 RepID=UPI0035B0FEC6
MSEVFAPQKAADPAEADTPARLRPTRRPGRGRVRLRTLLAIRWVAVAGQAASLAIVDFVLGYPIPLLPAALAVAALAVATLVPQVRRKSNARLNDRDSALYFAFDMVQLSVLLFLTGGLHNPFSLLLLAPVTVSAAALSFRSTLGLTALAITCINTLGIFHYPLPWPDGSFDLPPVFVFGLTIALVLAVVFISVYVFKVAEESRRVADALMAVQSALDREQRISSVGALAAAAAHELGSPLGTISLIAKELTRDLPTDSPYRGDAELLLSQANRCRDILAEIAARPEQSSQGHFHVLAAPLLVEVAAEPFRRPSVALRIETRSEGGEQEPPIMPRRPEIMHGLGNLLQNAIEFAREEVQVLITWSRHELSITITDDGVGFPPDLLDRLGDPYVSATLGRGSKLGARQLAAATGRAPTARKGDHMGLGIFIAQNLLERSGGSVQFGNNEFGGAEVKVIWPRSALKPDVN